ncbi:DUF1080 domain-containing protein, partial [bacterium]|nr:DUF1080 domain-containing protein [bacterium]
TIPGRGEPVEAACFTPDATCVVLRDVRGVWAVDAATGRPAAGAPPADRDWTAVVRSTDGLAIRLAGTVVRLVPGAGAGAAHDPWSVAAGRLRAATVAQGERQESAARRQADWVTAAAHADRLAALAPGDPGPRVRAAQAWALIGRPDRAALHAVRAAWDDPAAGRAGLWGQAFPTGLGHWRVEGGAVAQTSPAAGLSWLWFGSPAWTDYDLELEAQRTAGTEGFGVAFRAAGPDTYLEANIGGYQNKFAVVEGQHAGAFVRLPGAKAMAVETGRWYGVKVEVRGPRFRVYVDGERVTEGTEARFSRGGVGLKTAGTAARFRAIRVTTPGGEELYSGLPFVHRPSIRPL